MPLTLDEVRQLIAPAQHNTCAVSAPTKQIVVCQRGWVMFGDVQQVGDDLVIENAKNIRKWGTTAGLGQLAASGPTGSTQLDDYGTVRVHVLAVVLRIDAPGWR